MVGSFLRQKAGLLSELGKYQLRAAPALGGGVSDIHEVMESTSCQPLSWPGQRVKQTCRSLHTSSEMSLIKLMVSRCRDCGSGVNLFPDPITFHFHPTFWCFLRQSFRRGLGACLPGSGPFSFLLMSHL